MTRGEVETLYADPARSWLGAAPVRFVATLLLVLLVYGFSIYFVDFDLGRLWSGLPKLAHWAGKAWPPDTRELDVLIERAIETLAMAVVGTTIGVVIAVPCCILAAQNITPSRLLYTPMRWFLNALRGIDSFIFALLFVAAVGLGPFAGVLGIGLHSAGTIAKLWSEAIEAVEPGPLEAAALTGANRLKVIRYALLPDVLPNLTSITLYVWEFNVRSSTVLGVVGAGGIGQELKNSVDLLDFARLFTIILIILAMVTVIDQFSAWLRRRLV
ncbi:MAG TPA: phosphonate ABC transporter, permease protein PhnE [Stellaceae bacterium]|nr:phosphonate ABC transporter, permease protein PhnE [Stellaceae bacterium]